MSGRLPLSVLLLVRDETRDVEALLPALAFAAEVVVVWDPRGDRVARDAAERLGARVFERAFDGFGAQRRFALGQCSQPHVLWLDADERPREGAAEAIARALAGGGLAQASVLRETRFLGKRIRFCGWQSERIVRLFARDAFDFDDAPVHERLVPLREGLPAPVALDVTLDHDSYATWDACVTKMTRYAAAGAAKAYAAGKRATLVDVIVRPPLRFLRQYVLQLGFLDGAHGWLLCALASTQVFLKYAALRDRSRRGAGAAAHADERPEGRGR